MLAGCGGNSGPVRASVEGSVFLNGEPLKQGVIRFMPIGDTAGPATSGTITNGTYKLEGDNGPVAGTNRVEIEANMYSFAADDEAAFVKTVENRKGPPPGNSVPVQYNRQSTLAAQIRTEYLNFYEFQLFSPDAK